MLKQRLVERGRFGQVSNCRRARARVKAKQQKRRRAWGSSTARRAKKYREKQASRGKVAGRKGIVTAWNVFYSEEWASKTGLPTNA